MPKKKRSALKRIRQTARRTRINTLARSASRTAVRVAKEAAGSGEAADVIGGAASALDKAVKRGAIHRNAARRRKSRIARAAAKGRRPPSPS